MWSSAVCGADDDSSAVSRLLCAAKLGNVRYCVKQSTIYFGFSLKKWVKTRRFAMFAVQNLRVQLAFHLASSLFCKNISDIFPQKVGNENCFYI